MAPTSTQETTGLSGRTAWARNLEAPLRDFLTTQSGSAAILLAATLAALVWANVGSSYEHVWHTSLAIRIAGAGISQDLRHWVNDGLMTFFFFVVGLEARREFDLGELRDRRRLLLPFLAGLGGMVIPIAIYLALNAAHPIPGGWGAAMSTDTAFALGMLAIVGRRFPDSLRAFILTVAVVDDLVALVVIAVAFTSSVAAVALAVGLGIFGLILIARFGGVHNGAVYLVLGVAAWVSLQKSGIDPVVVGLAMGLLTIAYRPRGPTSSGPPTCSASSASSRPQSTPSRRGRGCARRSRPTSAISSCCTRSPATRSCPCSPSPTPAS